MNMKKILSFATIAITLFACLCSCTKLTTEGVTRTTYYPTLSLEGESTIFLDKGASFVEPGYYAELNGEDVTSNVEVKSNINSAVSGVYSVTYTILNEDGFASNASRKIIVLDPNDPVEGVYMVDKTSDRNGTYYGGYEVLIIGEGGGDYSVEDLLGGWYWLRAGYGTSYAMSATINIADDGTVSLVDSYVPGWGDSADSFEGSYDFASNTLSYTTVYAGTLTFNVNMIKE